MPQSLALSDLVVPYVLRAEDLGANHAILSVLRVESFESAADSLGTVIRGRASFQGSLRIDPAAGRLDFQNDETDPPFDPDRRSPVFDIRETHIDFELFVPRASSAIIAQRLALDCGSQSYSSTSLPSRTAAVARAMAVVVLPTPPFRLIVEIIIEFPSICLYR